MNMHQSFLRGMGWGVCIIAALAVLAAAQTPPPERDLGALAVRTQLRPVAWKEGSVLWFAPGPIAYDDWEKGVQSGILDETRSLKIWNTTREQVFGPGFIRFERSAGGVKEGTLESDSTICVVNTASEAKLNLTFARQTTVEFGYDGCVMKGTLAEAATLKTWDGKMEACPAGSRVEFNGAGELTRFVKGAGKATALDGEYTGTLQLSCPELWLDAAVKSMPFRFAASGGEFSGGHEDEPYSLRWQGNYDETGKITKGMMTGWIDFRHEVEGKLRWTITGPITGTLAAPASGTLMTITATDPDRLPEPIECNGVWTAAKTPGGDLIPTTEGKVVDIAKGAKGCMDLIFVIDLTSSMSDDIDQVKKTAKTILNSIATAFPDFRVAIVGYRDWSDSEMFKDVPFSSDAAEIQASIDSLTVSGGGDTPEAVLEAALRAIALPWRDGCNKQIILMGDAPPHSPIPQGPDKGKTAVDVLRAAYEVDPAVINTILIANSPGSFSEEARTAFAELSSKSGGTSTTADKAEEVPARMMEMVATIKKTSSLPTTGGGGGGGIVGLPSGGFPSWAVILLGALGALLLVLAVLVLSRRSGAAPVSGAPLVQASLEIRFPDGRLEVFPISQPRIVIGRGVDNQLILDDGAVSLRHAEILAGEDGFRIRDLGSANGTMVNGRQVEECGLYLGDEIALGPVRITLGR